MTKEEFRVIFDNYFSSLKSSRKCTDPKRAFCAYAEFLRERKKQPEIVNFEIWRKRKNYSRFGYGDNTNYASMWNYYSAMLLAKTKGEPFLDYIPLVAEIEDTPLLTQRWKNSPGEDCGRNKQQAGQDRRSHRCSQYSRSNYKAGVAA